ncbi:EamA family transporter [Litorivicinus lipolyticus]|uniref:EamA family transporter n=1 Tax=Litorivicinus lipolyticus TaxID=418701 RepID=A0A5Q2QD29_9GAMM|nr:DMT family transporter [Litorivicinus lipolyticus]QGG79926.1 EamA family transporter [Litorivicinus lipolyticus]
MPSFHTLVPWLFLGFWSAGYAVAKVGLEYTTPLNLLAFRFAGAVVALTPLVFMLRLTWPAWTSVKALMGTGLFLQVGHFGSVYIGLKLGASAGIMALFAASQPVLIILAGALFRREMPSFKLWLGLAMGLAGAGWVIGIQMDGQTGYLLGALMGFLAVVGLSIGQVIEKQRKLNVHPIMGTWIQYLFAAAVSVPVAFAIEGFHWSTQPAFIVALGYLVVGNSVIGIMLMFSMVRRGSLAQVSAIMFLVPAVGALLAWPIAGEVVPWVAVPGMALAMLGALWTRRVTAQPQA